MKTKWQTRVTSIQAYEKRHQNDNDNDMKMRWNDGGKEVKEGIMPPNVVDLYVLSIGSF